MDTDKNENYRRGDSAHYKELARKSSLQRIRRKIAADVHVCREGAKIPSKSRDTDVGYDICTLESARLKVGDKVRLPTGLQVKCPPGYFYMILPRSSSTRKGLVMDGPAIIDPTYTGELFITVRRTNTEDRSNPAYKVDDHPDVVVIEAGDRLAQLVFFPAISVDFHEVDEFDNDSSERGTNGYGSTGR
jgi:dUTP pyrophosphatase